MVAEVGGAAAAGASRKNCQINLLMHYPQGFTYTVLNTQFRGYADIPAGYTGLQSATYYFSGRTYPIKLNALQRFANLIWIKSGTTSDVFTGI